ncbi:MAG: hypothetical protein WAO91_04245 [Candidatus Nitrosotenuis sp.]
MTKPTYGFKVASQVDQKRWDEDLMKSQSAYFFQTAEYQSFMANSKNKTPIFISIVDGTGATNGQLGLIIDEIPMTYSTTKLRVLAKGVSKLGKRATWAGGPIIHSGDHESRMRILRTIIEALDFVAQKYNIIMIDGYTSPRDAYNENFKDELKLNGYKINDFFTFMTNLSKSDEEIWNGLNKNAQRDVLRAEKRGIVVKELTLDALDEYFSLSKVWAKTKGITKSIPHTMKENYWNYYKKGVEKVFLAYEEGELVATHRLGCFNGIMYSHSLINSYEKQGSLGGPYLTWFAIKWAKQNGIRYFDFSGGESPPDGNDEQYQKQWSSLLAYKRKWGGQEIPYFHWIKIRKKLSYKAMRALLRVDWSYRSFKKKKHDGAQKVAK